MLKIHIDPKHLKILVEEHGKKILPKIKKQLEKRGNGFLKTYFTDKLILEILTAPADKLLPTTTRITSDLEQLKSKKIVKARLKNVFSHTTFFKKPKSDSYCAFDICYDIGLNTCPYCNLNLITTIFIQRKPKQMIVRPPLDHFFPVSNYPMLALSYFNLIPSCWTCNSSFKGDKPCSTKTHIHPYVEGFGTKCTFSFSGAKIDEILSPTSKDFEIVFMEPGGDKRFSENIRMFKLDKMYNQHKQTAKRTLLFADRYPAAQIRSIEKIARATGSEVCDLIFHSNFAEERLHEQPFSKINRDILSQFGSSIIKKTLGI